MPIEAPLPNAIGLERMAKLKPLLLELERLLTITEGAGAREAALARTHLETAAMWGNKALCIRHPESQQVFRGEGNTASPPTGPVSTATKA